MQPRAERQQHLLWFLGLCVPYTSCSYMKLVFIMQRGCHSFSSPHCVIWLLGCSCKPSPLLTRLIYGHLHSPLGMNIPCVTTGLAAVSQGKAYNMVLRAGFWLQTSIIPLESNAGAMLPARNQNRKK